MATQQPKTVSFGDRVISSGAIPYMRSRNIEFTAKRLKPLTRLYSFFGGVDVNQYVVPKLLEISMISGVFQVGETVIGSFDNPGSSLPRIKFRVAQKNHKYGAYNSPSDVYVINPYDTKLLIPELYSSTSTILNIDTYSLSNQPQGQFTGYVSIGMKLRGQTSGAEATITDVKLVSDQIGVLIGSFFIPDGNIDVNPRFECGTKVFRLTSSKTNSQVVGTFSTSAEERYLAEGTMKTVQENVIVTRPIKLEFPPLPDMPIEGPGGSSPDFPSDDSGDFESPNVPNPVRPRPPISTPSKSVVYYNYAKKPLGEAGVKDFKSMARAAGLSKTDLAKISTSMTAKQQSNLVSKINSSSWASKNNVSVSTNNTGTKRTASGTVVGGIKTGQTRAAQTASSGGMGTSSGSMGGSSGGAAMGSSGGGGGGMGGGMSDVNLKTNIQPINNALNRLFNLNFK